MVRVGWSTAAVSPVPMTLAQTPEQLVRVEFVHADMCVPAASPTDSTLTAMRGGKGRVSVGWVRVAEGRREHCSRVKRTHDAHSGA